MYEDVLMYFDNELFKLPIYRYYTVCITKYNYRRIRCKLN